MAISLAMIPLAPKARLSAKAILADLAEHWPDEPEPNVEKLTDKQQIWLDFGDEAQVAIAIMPAPIPKEDIDYFCNNTVLWPKAAEDLEPMTGHLIVTAMGFGDAVQRSAMLTRVCASIVATCDEAIGVLWSAAELLIPAKMFIDFARDILPDPPLFIWMNFHSERAGGKTQAYTTGLAELGLMEFETEDASDKPSELVERFHAIANYLIENGPVIKDGDTVGEDAKERIKVYHTKSVFGKKGKVMRFEWRARKR